MVPNLSYYYVIILYEKYAFVIVKLQLINIHIYERPPDLDWSGISVVGTFSARCRSIRDSPVVLNEIGEIGETLLTSHSKSLVTF